MSVCRNINRIAVILIAILLAACMSSAVAEGTVTTDAIPVEVSVVGTAPAVPETYTVTMTPNDAANPMPEGASEGEYALTITGAGTGSIPGMTFTDMGNYTYTIVQQPGSNPLAVSYDSTVYTLNVWVTRNITTNAYEVNYWLTEEGVEGKPDKCAFVNEYIAPEPVTHNPPVKKIIDGEGAPKGDTFKFSMTAKTNTAGLDQMPMPGGAASQTVTVEVKGGEEKEFGVITFDKDGTYVYEVAEVKGSAPGYEYDNTVYTLIYDITLNATKYEKKLTVKKGDEVVDKSVFDFTNTYTPPTVTADPIPVDKVISGSPSKPATFQFKLTAKTEGAPMPSAATVSVTGAGTASFEAITFDKEGTYEYELSEVNDGVGGYTYDTTVYTLKYTLTKGKNGLEYKLTATNASGAYSEKTFVFTNKYSVTADPIPVEKIVSGSPSTKATFQFKLTAKTEGAPIPSTATVSVTGAGTVSFEAITFDKAGTYEYELSEVNGGVSGYTYDTSVYTLTYTVTEGDKGLECALTSKKGSSAYSEKTFKFTNKYSTGGGGTPTGGDNLKTGDEMPVYPFILAGIALLALIGIAVVNRKKKNA